MRKRSLKGRPALVDRSVLSLTLALCLLYGVKCWRRQDEKERSRGESRISHASHGLDPPFCLMTDEGISTPGETDGDTR